MADQYHVGPTDARWTATDLRSHPLVDRAYGQHPNPSHIVRPAMLPWNRAGVVGNPTRTLPANTLTRGSGVRR